MSPANASTSREVSGAGRGRDRREALHVSSVEGEMSVMIRRVQPDVMKARATALPMPVEVF